MRALAAASYALPPSMCSDSTAGERGIAPVMPENGLSGRPDDATATVPRADGRPLSS
ncbi:hypothetical protein [Xanthomonas nasturtii]|uniref:hypothetical protein n=1 Tax=Xanthomonas nasturtii TaxID=1843581 RepID=UPI0020122DBE|nr:hypothetical protein [Xanthomonas nasturtii]